MTDNCQTMVPDTTPPPAPDLAAVMAWFESYGAGYNPQYMCEGCIVEGEYSCRHFIDITGSNAGQFVEHMISTGRTGEQLLRYVGLFNSIRYFQLPAELF